LENRLRSAASSYDARIPDTVQINLGKLLQPVLQPLPRGVPGRDERSHERRDDALALDLVEAAGAAPSISPAARPS
jgi:hypothetical protein